MSKSRTASLELNTHRVGALSLVVLAVATLMLSGCNTTEGAGRDVAATGRAVTRGAADVKNGL